MISAAVARYGAWAVTVVTVALATWLILAALRAPFVLVARLLGAAQGGIDARIADRLAAHRAVAPASSSRRFTHV